MNRSKENTRAGVFKKLGYIFDRRDKWKIGMLLIAVVIGSFLELLGVTIFMPFINIIQEPGEIYRKWYLRLPYEFFHFQSAKSFLAALSLAIIVIYVIKNVYLILEKSYIYRFSYNTQMKLSTRLLSTYMKEPYTFHLNKNIATLQRSLQEDTSKFMQVVLYSLELVAELAVCFVLVIYLLFVSKSITIIVLGLLVLCVGSFLLLTRRYSRKLGQDNQGYQGKIFQWMNQALGGIKEIKILERESFFTDEYRRYYEKFARGLRIARTISILPKYAVEAVAIY